MREALKRHETHKIKTRKKGADNESSTAVEGSSGGDSKLMKTENKLGAMTMPISPQHSR